jgi:hypothetical protein
VNALSVSESERLLRQSVNINDARILIVETGTDTVDIHVFVQDKWSITIPVGADPHSANATVRDQNFLGLGQQFQQYVGYKEPNRMEYSGFYNIANLDNTYISSRLSYLTNNDGTQVGLSFERPFYSPLSQWAGGVYVSRGQHFYVYRDTTDGVEKKMNLFNNGYDVWLGKNIKLPSKRTFFGQSNNIILAGRYYGSNYFKRPPVAFDLASSFGNSCAYIGNVGYSVQQYYKDKYIYRFGSNEDVPEGFIFQLLYGAEKTEFLRPRYYTGAEIAHAKHFGFGYLSATASYSLFFSRYIANDLTSYYRFYYFSDLFRGGRWFFRQFANYNLVYGVNKTPAEKLTITANDLYGFNSAPLSGNTKMVLQTETVAYAPWQLIGFRFAPVLSTGFALIDSPNKDIFRNTIYQAYTLGLMIRNENLLSSTFQVSFGMYPYLPNGESYKLKYNPITSFTLRVRAFSVSKPTFLVY